MGKNFKKIARTLAVTVKEGQVLHVLGACLPPLVVVEFLPHGEDRGDPPTLITRPLQELTDFSVRDREAGLPSCHFVRDHEWLSRDSWLEIQGDLVITDQVVRLRVANLEDFQAGVEVAGQVSQSALKGIQRKLFAVDDEVFAGLTKEDLAPRLWMMNAVYLALDTA